MRKAHKKLKDYDAALQALKQEQKAYGKRGIKLKDKLLALRIEEASLMSLSKQTKKADRLLEAIAKQTSKLFAAEHLILGRLAVVSAAHCYREKRYPCARQQTETGIHIYAVRMHEQGISDAKRRQPAGPD